MTDELDERYARASALADLDKRHSVLDATVTHQLTRVSSDLSEIKLLVLQRSGAPAQQHDSVILAVHDLAKSVRENAQQPAGRSSIQSVLAYVGAIALGALGVWAFLHH